MEKLYTRLEVSEYLGVIPVTISRWIQKGKLPHIRLGREIRISESQLQEFINRFKVNSVEVKGE